MKKVNYLSVIGLLAVICFSSCKDEPVVVSSAVTVATKDSATISGYLTAELNLQSAGLEAVPTGTSVLVSLPYSQLNSSATGSWLKTVTVGTDGKFSVKVPTNSKGVTVTIKPSDFEFNQIQAYVSGAIVPNLKLTYSIGSSSIVAVSGQSLNNDIVYTGISGIAIGVARINISGKAQADLDASIIGLENLPDGTKIIFTSTGWADSTSITAGKYTMAVPKGVAVKWSINKIINIKVWSSNSSNPSLSSYINIDQLFTISGSNLFSANSLSADITPSGSTVMIPTPLTTNVSGYATVELDLSVNGLENIPTGTKIYFYSSTWGDNATVTNGNYNIKVPAGTTINYYIQFSANQKSQSGVLNTHTFYVKSSFYSGTDSSTNFNFNVPDTFVTTTLMGTAKVDLDLSVSGVDNIPNGTKIYFSTTNPSWSEYAVVTNGTYAINVPVNNIVNYTISFSANQKSATGIITTKTFQLSNYTNSSLSGNTTTLNLTAL